MSGRSPRWIQKISRGTPLGDIEVGTLVKLNENGLPVEFYVAKHDYESTLNGAGRTLLVRKDVYSRCQYSSTSSNLYTVSVLDSTITGTWFNLLDGNIQELAGITKFYCMLSGEVGTVERKAFALSLTELGLTEVHAPVEGETLPIATTLRRVKWGNTNYIQWTRSRYTTTQTTAFGVNSSGMATSYRITYSYGSRPCITLPATTETGDDMLIA